MRQAITGFVQDEEGDWVAELACGHRQHVRHKPPWLERPWVVKEASRATMLGAPLECPLCNREEAVSALPSRLQSVHQRMARAAHAAGRDPADIRLLPISKTQPAETLRQAHHAGLRRFGENKVQELCGKAETLHDLDLDWVLVGHLQSNKVKQVVAHCAEFQALDSLKLAAALDRRLQQAGRTLDVLVQVNTSGETSKYGVAPDALLAFARELPHFSALRVRGLMTLAHFSATEAVVRPCFRRLREWRDVLRQQGPPDLCWDELSMGMSGDFEWAIAEGSTTVRVGQALFGPRRTPDSHYWPDPQRSGSTHAHEGSGNADPHGDSSSGVKRPAG